MMKPLALFRSPADSHLHKLIKVNIAKSHSSNSSSNSNSNSSSNSNSNSNINKLYDKKIIKIKKSYSSPL